MDKQLASNITSSNHWIRFLFMLLFALLIQVASGVMWVVVVVQFFFHLFNGDKNSRISDFSESLSVFIYQCWQFLNYTSDEKPYPFQDWPLTDD